MHRKCVIVTGIYPPDIGGPAAFASRFSQFLSESTDVQVLTYTDGKPRFTIENGVAVQRISRLIPIWRRYIHFLRQSLKLKVQGYSFLVIGGFIEALAAHLLFRVNYVAKVPGDIVWERARNNGFTNVTMKDFQTSKLDIKYKVFRRLYSLSLTRAGLVIVPSKELFELCLSWGVKQHNLRLIYNSVDQETFFPSKSPGISFDVITVCRLTPWKGVADLISITSKLNLSLLVIGDGPERENLEKLSDNLGASTLFLGNIPSEKMPDYFRMAKVFVLNSEYEGLPHALLEARSCGCLTVARAGTGSQEVIENKVTGYLTQNSTELEVTLANIFSGSDALDQIVEAALKDTEERFMQNLNFQRIRALVLPE